MRVLSLFDGMACGMIAMKYAGVDVESYDAYEIDKYAIKTAQHNFPIIEEHGDVFSADFSQYEGIDFLIGGSPCTHWSIAQTKHRETTASGIGWDLFSQYLRALHEAKPKYFIYENNKSMASAIRAQITSEFGFEPVCINSALVSAQNRQRLYWVGKREPDGTYSQVHVEQPEDIGILLRDILETGIDWQEKSYCITATEYKGSNVEQTLTKHRRTMVEEPIRISTIENDAKNPDHDSQQYRVYSPDGKSVTLCGNGGGLGAKTGLYAVPVIEQNACCVAQRGRYIGENGSVAQHFEARDDGKTNTLTTVQKDNLVAVPCCMRYERTEEAKRLRKQYEAHEIKHGFHEFAELHPRADEKSNTLTTVLKDNLICEPLFYDENGERGFSFADGKKHQVYEVRGGRITIKGKEYPIKLRDGYYIIRKLTVTECKRLQTVPDDYEFPVSNTQAYKMLGNGWTCEVIAHLIRSILIDKA